MYCSGVETFHLALVECRLQLGFEVLDGLGLRSGDLSTVGAWITAQSPIAHL